MNKTTNNSSESSIRSNAIFNIIYKLSSLIFPLLVYPYVSRVLTSEYLGKVSFFYNLASYGLLIGSIGISTYGIRAVASVRDDKEKLSKTVTELLVLNSIITFIVIFLLGISTIWVSKFKSNIILLIITVAQIAIAPLSMDWLYSGLEEYSYITKRAIVFKVVSFVLIFLFVHSREDYVKYALIMAVSCVGNYICNFVHSFRFINYGGNKKLQLIGHLRPSLILFASLLAVSIYTSLDSLMLGFINGDNAVGLYDVAVKGKTVILSLINAISAVLLPRLSYYVAKNETEQYASMLQKSSRYILMIAVPLMVFFEIEAFDTINILGGSNYADAVLCMQILMPILVISGFSNITGNQILIPHGMDSCFTKAVSCGAIIDLILNFILMPKYSIYGAAIATLIAEIVQMSVQTFYSRQYLRGRINVKDIIEILLAAVFSGILTVAIRQMLTFNSFISIMICGCVYFIVYGVFVIMQLKKHEDFN